MFQTILAGCDGFSRGRGAVAFASTLAEATGARLLLVAAHPNPPLPFPAGLQEQHDRADRAIRRVRDELAPTGTAMVVEALSPAHALCDTAEREGADLIVVGSRRRTRAARMLDADHALQVLHGAPTSVAVVPESGPIPAQLERIAIALDGSVEAHGALTIAADLARATGARLWLQVVADNHMPAWGTGAPGFVQPPDWDALLERRRTSGQELLDTALEHLEADGIDAQGAVSVGDPARKLAEAGATADLLVMGSRRWGPIGRLALGSTSEAVVRRAGAPVVVLQRPVTETESRPSGGRRTGATAR
jgi:nucleotide-binding universal stress UspA family protein